MSDKNAFVPLGQVEPELAKLVTPGVRFMVSKKTFADVAREMSQRQQDKEAGNNGAPDAPSPAVAEGQSTADRFGSAPAAVSTAGQDEPCGGKGDVDEQLRNAADRAHAHASMIRANASAEAGDIVAQARADAERIVALAGEEAELRVNKALEELRGQVASLAVQGAEAILKREVNRQEHAEMLRRLSGELGTKAEGAVAGPTAAGQAERPGQAAGQRSD